MDTCRVPGLSVRRCGTALESAAMLGVQLQLYWILVTYSSKSMGPVTSISARVLSALKRGLLNQVYISCMSVCVRARYHCHPVHPPTVLSRRKIDGLKPLVLDQVPNPTLDLFPLFLGGCPTLGGLPFFLLLRFLFRLRQGGSRNGRGLQKSSLLPR